MMMVLSFGSIKNPIIFLNEYLQSPKRGELRLETIVNGACEQ